MTFSGFMSRVGCLLGAAGEEDTGAGQAAFAGISSREARVLRNGSWSAVPVSGIRDGETVRIEPGEVVPVPGIVTDGDTSVDMSVLVGWPLVARIVEGGRVSPGAVNLSSAIEITVSSPGRMPSVESAPVHHGTVDAES